MLVFATEVVMLLGHTQFAAIVRYNFMAVGISSVLAVSVARWPDSLSRNASSGGFEVLYLFLERDIILLFFTSVMLNAGVLLLMNLDLPIAQRMQSFSKHGGGGQLLSNASNSHDATQLS